MKRKPTTITDGTSSIACGPLSFDVDMARRHGWTDEHICRVYDRLSEIVGRAGAYVQGRHPELYGRQRGMPDVVIYIGPDDNGHSLNPKDYLPVRGRRPRKPDRRSVERRADKRRTDDKRKARLKR